MNTPINDIKALYAKPQEFIIGKELPQEEQRKIIMFPLEADDMDTAEISQDLPITQQKEEIFKMVAKMLRCEPEEVRHIAIPYLKDIMDAVAQCNKISTEASDKMRKTVLSEKKEQAMAALAAKTA